MALEIKPEITFAKFANEHLRLKDETMSAFMAGYKRLTDKDKQDLARWGCDEFGYAGITLGGSVSSESVVTS